MALGQRDLRQCHLSGEMINVDGESMILTYIDDVTELKRAEYDLLTTNAELLHRAETGGGLASTACCRTHARP